MVDNISSTVADTGSLIRRGKQRRLCVGFLSLTSSPLGCYNVN